MGWPCRASPSTYFGATWGQFHKTLQIRKLRICSYGQILTVNLLINCKNSVINGKMAVNYEEKCFMEQAPVRTSTRFKNTTGLCRNGYFSENGFCSDWMKTQKDRRRKAYILQKLTLHRRCFQQYIYFFEFFDRLKWWKNLSSFCRK